MNTRLKERQDTKWSPCLSRAFTETLAQGPYPLGNMPQVLAGKLAKLVKDGAVTQREANAFLNSIGWVE